MAEELANINEAIEQIRSLCSQFKLVGFVLTKSENGADLHWMNGTSETLECEASAETTTLHDGKFCDSLTTKISFSKKSWEELAPLDTELK